ncbi:MAG: hypothetical protein GY785_02260 [Gammaproteobacteria bacterium]|nr:hypothetical protein [Gammaproteobacteria bacterium]
MSHVSNNRKDAQRIADLVTLLIGESVECRVGTHDRAEFETAPQELIEQVLSSRLTVSVEPKPSFSPDVTNAQTLYDALFDQSGFLERYTPEHPLKIAMFRGGRGAKTLTFLLADLPNVSLQIVLGATDDGRSWYIAATGFNATGVPDAGKSLLDLARDADVKKFLAARLKEEEGSNLHAEVAEFIRLIEGDANALLSTQTRSLHDLLMSVSTEKRQVLLRFLSTFQSRYSTFPSKTTPTRTTDFSFHNIPLRSIVLVGAAWHFDGDWQRAVDSVGKLLDIGPHRVLFPTVERQHLVAMTSDGIIYFAETGINEHPKQSDFFGLWLVSQKLDINEFTTELQGQHISLEELTQEAPSSMSEEERDLQSEIRKTTRKIVDSTEQKLQQTAVLIAERSCTARTSRQGPVPALQEAESVLRTADIIVYAPTTLESNIGSALIIPGLQRAICENTHAVKIHFVNPTLDNDKPDTTALDMVTRLARYASGQQVYLTSEIDWKEMAGYVEYIVGIGKQFQGRDKEKNYIPFDDEEIHRDTDGHLIPVPLNLELANPTLKQSKDYAGYDEEYGFYDPAVMKEALIALLGIKMAGFQVKSNDEKK